jgi:hypothetical protein
MENLLMGKSTFNGHFQSLFVCLPEGSLFCQSNMENPQSFFAMQPWDFPAMAV